MSYMNTLKNGQPFFMKNYSHRWTQYVYAFHYHLFIAISIENIFVYNFMRDEVKTLPGDRKKTYTPLALNFTSFLECFPYLIHIRKIINFLS